MTLKKRNRPSREEKMKLDTLKSAIIKVGGGRGFVIKLGHDRLE